MFFCFSQKKYHLNQSNIYLVKGLIIFAILALFTLVIKEKLMPSEATDQLPGNISDKITSHLQDGWHLAEVTYSSHKKLDQSTLDLKVEVKKDKVIQVDLGNGITLHDSENDSGYFYSGGVLSFDLDPESKITVASTSVIIRDTSGNLIFYIVRINVH